MGRTCPCRPLLTTSHHPVRRHQVPLGVVRPALLPPSLTWRPLSRPLLPSSSCDPASCSSSRPLRSRLTSPLLAVADPGSHLWQAALQTSRPEVLAAAGPWTSVSHLWLVPLLLCTRYQGTGSSGSRGLLHRMRQHHLPYLSALMCRGEQGDAVHSCRLLLRDERHVGHRQ